MRVQELLIFHVAVMLLRKRGGGVGAGSAARTNPAERPRNVPAQRAGKRTDFGGRGISYLPEEQAVAAQRAPQNFFCNISRGSARISFAVRCAYVTVCAKRKHSCRQRSGLRRASQFGEHQSEIILHKDDGANLIVVNLKRGFARPMLIAIARELVRVLGLTVAEIFE